MITCEIITPNGPYKTIECQALTVGTIDGERGLLEHHMPIVLMLDISKLVLTIEGEKKYYAIAGGMLYFENGVAKILVDSIEAEEDIDVDRAISAKERAEKRLQSKDKNYDMRRAEIALKKAINRIRVSSI